MVVGSNKKKALLVADQKISCFKFYLYCLEAQFVSFCEIATDILWAVNYNVAEVLKFASQSQSDKNYSIE